MYDGNYPILRALVEQGDVLWPDERQKKPDGSFDLETNNAYAIVNVMDRVCSFATLGVASASSVMIGHSVGRGDFPRAQKEGLSFLLMSVVFGIFSSALVLIAGTWSVGLYKINESTFTIAVIMMESSAVVVFFHPHRRVYPM